MKIAVLSDIHGNLPALQVVLAYIDQWRPDHVIINGDVINRGPCPRACWELVAERLDRDAWQMTLGNHEEYTAAWAKPRPELSGVQAALYQTSRWTFEQLSAETIRTFKQLPQVIELNPCGRGRVVAAHASVDSTTKGVGPWSTDDDIRERMGDPPNVFLTAHTHRFIQRIVDDTLVVNSGSVGCPLDGDIRTGYAQLTWHKGEWNAELVRLDYDRDQAERNFEAVNYEVVCGPSAPLMVREWREARSHIPQWTKIYRDRVVAGEIDAWESVRAYFASL